MEDEMINEFTSIEDIDTSKAKALYEAGYTTFENLHDAAIEALTSVEGITPQLAENIKDHVSRMFEEVEGTVVERRLDPEYSRLLKVRKRQKHKKPHFVQTDQHKKKRLKDTWRRPKGLHNKKRRYILAKGEMARVGYGSPAAVKGLHPSGFEEVFLDRVQELDSFDPHSQAIRIAGSLGQRKRMQIVNKARSLGLKILNPPLEEEVE
jgi:large subunit ribosomal protein L32e